MSEKNTSDMSSPSQYQYPNADELSDDSDIELSSSDSDSDSASIVGDRRF